MGANETAGLLLLDGVLPLWVAAGLADWACHWRTGIEHTAGLAESAFHWLMFSREPALPGRLVAGVLLAVLVFNAVPLLHEFWRTWVARRRRFAQQQARP